MSFIAYVSAIRYLNEGLIRFQPQREPGGRTARDWMRSFLDVIGHPEAAFPVIHVAGTAGKSSTALYIAEILRAHGLKVGLHVSPYLQSATERLWVNGRYVSGMKFVELVEWIRPFADKWRGVHSPIHAMASLAIALEHFKREGVDVAIIESSTRGRDDVSNVCGTITSVVCGMTSGRGLASDPVAQTVIAQNMAVGRPGVPLVVLAEGNLAGVEEEARRIGAELILVRPGERFSHLTSDPQDNRFSYRGGITLECLAPGMYGYFQACNAAMAVTAAEYALAKLGRQMAENPVRGGLEAARLPARLEVVRRRPRVLLDGAYDPQKLEASLRALCSDRFRGKLVSIMGLLAHDNVEEMAAIMAAFSRHVVVTEPSVYGRLVLPAERLSGLLTAQGVKVTVARTPASALEEANRIADGDDRILVTGSPFLAGEVRDHWYGHEKVVIEEQSYPD